MNIVVDGITYFLGHMDTETHAKVPMMDERGVTFEKPVMVVYSCHCYSKGEKAGVPFNPAPGALIWDGSKRREFCPQRYSMSLMLPAIVKRMIYSPLAVVWDTGYGNRHYHELIGTPNQHAGHPYYIFMRISKEKLMDGPRVIKMAVESAYYILPPDPQPRATKPMSMREWLAKVWANK